MQVCTSLQTHNHASTPPISFLQARCPSCCPTNSVKALKAFIIQYKQIQNIRLLTSNVQNKQQWQQKQIPGVFNSKLTFLATVTNRSTDWHQQHAQRSEESSVNLLECVAEHHGKKVDNWKLGTVLEPRQMNGDKQTQKLCQPVHVTTHQKHTQIYSSVSGKTRLPV